MKKQVHQHETHVDIAKRLKRAKGHINKIIEMIEAQRSCLDIAQQSMLSRRLSSRPRKR